VRRERKGEERVELSIKENKREQGKRGHYKGFWALHLG
jgi:hypothetical protein